MQTMQARLRANSAPGTQTHERRRHQRVRVALLGRYMLASRQEYPCQTLDMSPGGVAIVAPVRGGIGERVIIYLEHLGRIEGEIVRHLDGGFAMSIAASQRKRDKLADQLTWLANRQALGLPEDRRHDRITPRQRTSVLTLADGARHPVRVTDVSLSGAALSTALRPPAGAAVVVGSTAARVVRHLEAGIAVEFVSPLPADGFDDRIVL